MGPGGCPPPPGSIPVGPGGGGGSGGGSGGMPGPPPHPAQTLPSNVRGKGNDRTMDQQYMQQSSQIFVFCTDWANRGAQAVIQGQFNTVISWHGAQPQTTKHLEVS